MENKYYSLVTDYGSKKMLEAANKEEKINIIWFAVGDGGGEFCVPETDAAQLKNEVWRGEINSCYISEESENIMIVESKISSDVGGFTIREMGIFDENNRLFAICNTPDTQKVKILDGVVHELILTMEIIVLNKDVLNLLVDPNVVTATKKDIEELENKIIMPNFDDTGEVEGIESFEDFMSSFVKRTSIYQLFTNLKAGLKYVLHTGQLVNSGMCETPGMFPLDAAYGKTLTDQITGLYSDIQMLRNDLAAVDTRVTNAINGGDLAAPYSLNVLNTPYIDSIVGASELTKTSATLTSFVTTGRGAQNAYMERLYSTPIKINGTKYKITFSGNCYASWPEYSNNNTHANNFRVCVLDASTNALLLQSTGSPLSLSNLDGKTIKIAFRTDTPTTEMWKRTMNINSCIISND